MATTSHLVSQFTESVIRRSTVWSIEHKAVNLSQGFPDDEVPKDLKQAAIEAIQKNRNQYSDTWGTLQLRDAVAAKANLFYNLGVNGVENVTITCGATEAMMASILAVVNPGEEVVIFEPAYENFRPHCLIAGAKPVFVPLADLTSNLIMMLSQTPSMSEQQQLSLTTRTTRAVRFSLVRSFCSSLNCVIGTMPSLYLTKSTNIWFSTVESTFASGR